MNTMSFVRAGILGALALAAGACNQPSQAAAGSSAAQSAADTLFAQRCQNCHGPEGKGDGTAAAALNPKPRNFHDTTWQKSTTDEQIEKAILEGGASIGKSPLMAPNPDLKDKPDVVKALRAKVRGFAS